MTRFRICRIVTALSLLAVPAAAEHLRFDSGGIELAYQLEGDAGSPVLLIHGFTASGDINWRLPGIVADLARDHRVVVLDNRGHGKSDKPEASEEYGVKMVEDAIRLLDHLGIDSAHFVGYSMGGMIAMKAMALYPERVRSAVIGGMGWIQAGEATRKRYEEGRSGARNAAHAACHRRFWELGLTEAELRAIDTPFALIIGSDDGLLQSTVEPLRKVRSEAPVVIIEGATHTSAVLSSEFRRAVHDYVDRYAASSAAKTGQ